MSVQSHSTDADVRPSMASPDDHVERSTGLISNLAEYPFE